MWWCTSIGPRLGSESTRGPAASSRLEDAAAHAPTAARCLSAVRRETPPGSWAIKLLRFLSIMDLIPRCSARLQAGIVRRSGHLTGLANLKVGHYNGRLIRTLALAIRIRGR